MATVPERIAADLKRQILKGGLRPGARLPDRRSLMRQFDASPITVQLAVTRLADEGFVTVGARKRGTFVADKPPHLHHYKLLFPYDPAYRGEFWRVLREEAKRMAGDTDRDFSFFYGLAGHRDIESYRTLVDEVRAERVAGLIFASGAAEFRGTPILDQPGIPRVAVASAYELPGIPKLQVDYASFFAQALDHLIAQGRRRIAVLFGASQGDDGSSPIIRDFSSCMAARGLAVNPLWTQFAEVWSSMSARRCLHLMLHGPAADRPDGLILADDNFIPSATQGIVDAGVQVPQDLSVVALANFPVGIEAVVPVTRIGFDAKAILTTLAGWIDLLREGGQPPEFQKVLAIGEDEYVGGQCQLHKHVQHQLGRIPRITDD